jgi:hypothetical protein
MPAGNTYEAIATISASGTTSATFTSIPQTYTDLVMVWGGSTSTTGQDVRFQVGNGSVDTGGNYSFTYLTGNGTTASSARGIRPATYILTQVSNGTASNNTFVWHFMNYANTTTLKTVLCRASSAESTSIVGLWNSTSAINTINVFPTGSTTFTAGSTFSLYGITAA